MKRLWLSVGLFLLLVTSSFGIISILVQPAAYADAHQLNYSDPNSGTLSVTYQSTFIDAAHIYTTISGTFLTKGTNNTIQIGNQSSQVNLSGMYYDNDLSSSDKFMQGGDKKVGVSPGCKDHQSYVQFIGMHQAAARTPQVNGDWDFWIPLSSTGINQCYEVKVPHNAGLNTDVTSAPIFSAKARASCLSVPRVTNCDTPVEIAPNFAKDGQVWNNAGIGLFLENLSRLRQVDNDPVYDNVDHQEQSYTRINNIPPSSISDNDWFEHGTSPTPGSCADQYRIYDPQPGGTALFSYNFKFTKIGNDCAAFPGTNPLPAYILINTPDQVVAGVTTAPTTIGSTGTGVSSPPDQCPGISNGALKWIYCDVVTNVTQALGSLSTFIQQKFINLNVDDVFGNGENAVAMQTAFNVFRVMAIGLLLVVAVAAVAGEASGFELSRDLNLRRIATPLVVAFFLLALLQPLLKMGLTVVDELSFWLPDALYAPFAAIGDNKVGMVGLDLWQVIGKLGTVAAGGLLGYFYAVTFLGPIGIFSLAVTAFVSVLIAFITVVLIKMIGTAVFIVFPLAIACRLIPGLKPVATIIFDGAKGFAIFCIGVPIVLTLGKVFAVLVPGTDTNPFSVIGRIACIILAWLAIPEVARLGGGLVANLTGRVNDRSRGIFDRQRKTRLANKEQRYKRWKAGGLANNRNVGRVYNNIGRRVGLGYKGLFPAQGRELLAIKQGLDAQNALKDMPLLAEAANHDKVNHLLAQSYGDKRRAQQIRDAKIADGSWSREDAFAAYNAANAIGFRRDTASAAFITSAQNKSREIGSGRIDQVAEMAAGLAGGKLAEDGSFRMIGGNQSLYKSLMYAHAHASRGAGRIDLGGHVLDIDRSKDMLRDMQDLMSTGLSQLRARQMVTMLSGISKTGTASLQNASGTSTKQLIETTKYLLEHGNANQRYKGALLVDELSKGLSSATDENRDLVTGFMRSLHLDATATRPVTVTVAGPNGTAQQVVQQQPVPMTVQLASLPSLRVTGLSPEQLASRIQTDSRSFPSGIAYAASGGGAGEAEGQS